MRVALRKLLKTFTYLVLVALLTFLLFDEHNDDMFKFNRHEAIIAAKDKSYPFARNYERKDWHDWEFIKYEKARQGPGEQGKPHVLTDPDDIAKNDKLFEVEGLYAVVSDKISANRSVPDTRLTQ